MTILKASTPNSQSKYWSILLLFFTAVIWLVAYNLIQPIANWVTFELIGMERNSHIGESLAFFFYDVPKVLLLLTGMIFLISLLQSFFSPERARELLGGKREGFGNVLAAMLGIVTPFCSCSAVPLFIGFVRSGVPLGVTFSFLIAAPTINEVAVVLLIGLFGWKIAGIYVLSGFGIAVVSGLIIGRLNLENEVEHFVYQNELSEAIELEVLTWPERLKRAWFAVKEIVGKVWLYVVIGIAVGAGIHGFVPEDALVGLMGKQAWWSVPIAILIGLPLYSNAAGIIPVVGAFMEKGASLGTVLAFMMSVVGLSLPEVVILRRVLKPKLIAIFIGTVASAIILIGYLFNWIKL